ncbi:carbon-nitrogen hydrolase [Cladochytrium replicatum]|nr:carbon-nitrogen hydrolase [Cladochytrium replicatum]
MKFGVLQFGPQFKRPDENRAKASKILERIQPHDIDVLVLPELIFSGYVFRSKEDIRPYAESESGPTIEWAKEQAIRLKAYVQVGYPRIEPNGKLLYNSVSLIDAEGNVVKTYDKTFLYETDETWAEEGSGFGSITLGKKRCAVGICMDINPKQFKAPYEAFEFGNFAKNQDVDLVLLSMAWVLKTTGPPSADSEDTTVAASNVKEPNMDTLEYWIDRLQPIIPGERGKDVIVVVANRVGGENGTIFTGTSTVMKFGNDGIEIGALMGQGIEGFAIAEF